jgi:hypothetical protein
LAGDGTAKWSLGQTDVPAFVRPNPAEVNDGGTEVSVDIPVNSYAVMTELEKSPVIVTFRVSGPEAVLTA